MALEAIGSTPTTHPIIFFLNFRGRVATLGCRQAVRHSTLTAALVGSNPATPAMKKRLHFAIAFSVIFALRREVLLCSDIRRCRVIFASRV